MIEKLEDFLKEIVHQVMRRSLNEFWCYSCDNGVQDLDRLCFHCVVLGDEYEVQINQIRHAKEAHCHGCSMMSLILEIGYGWWLHQSRAKKAIYQFSAPGSLITLESEDVHWIPFLKTPSLSLCVFNKPSDWHLYYTVESPLSVDVAGRMLERAKCSLREQFLDFNSVFGS